MWAIQILLNAVGLFLVKLPFRIAGRIAARTTGSRNVFDAAGVTAVWQDVDPYHWGAPVRPSEYAEIGVATYEALAADPRAEVRDTLNLMVERFAWEYGDPDVARMRLLAKQVDRLRSA